MKILFATARFPYPLTKGDKIVSYQRLRYLSKKHEITLVSFIDGRIKEEDLREVKKYCREIYLVAHKKSEIIKNIILNFYKNLPFQVLYYKSKNFQRIITAILNSENYDCIHVFMSRIIQYFKETTTVPIILELIDSMGLNMLNRSKRENGVKKLFFEVEAKRIGEYERAVLKKVDVGIVVSEIDKNFIGDKKIVVVPNGVDVSIFTSIKVASRRDNVILFFGNMGYFSNKIAVIYFLDKIWPLVKKECSSVEFHIAGYSAKVLKRYVGADRRVRIFDSVINIVDYIQRSTVAVCPMLAGSGMQNKILEALACGIPVVATPLGKGDIRISEEEGLFVENMPQKFAQRVIILLRNRNYRKKLSAIANNSIRNNYSWERNNFEIEQIYSKLAGGTSKIKHGGS
jgi:glycosyltransferase involved in cell wall biosynthesis